MAMLTNQIVSFENGRWIIERNIGVPKISVGIEKSPELVGCIIEIYLQLAWKLTSRQDPSCFITILFGNEHPQLPPTFQALQSPPSGTIRKGFWLWIYLPPNFKHPHCMVPNSIWKSKSSGFQWGCSRVGGWDGIIYSIFLVDFHDISGEYHIIWYNPLRLSGDSIPSRFPWYSQRPNAQSCTLTPNKSPHVAPLVAVRGLAAPNAVNAGRSVDAQIAIWISGPWLP